MKRYANGVVPLTFLIAFGRGIAGAQYPPLSAEETATVERDATSLVETYFRLFSARETKAIGERIFQTPWILIEPGGTKVYGSPEETAALFDGSLASIVPNGWEKSEFPNPVVCALSAASATVSGKFYRYRRDGSVMSEHGVTYVVGKTPAGWRVVALSSHPPDRALECRD